MTSVALTSKPCDTGLSTDLTIPATESQLYAVRDVQAQTSSLAQSSLSESNAVLDSSDLKMVHKPGSGIDIKKYFVGLNPGGFPEGTVVIISSSAKDVKPGVKSYKIVVFTRRGASASRDLHINDKGEVTIPNSKKPFVDFSIFLESIKSWKEIKGKNLTLIPPRKSSTSAFRHLTKGEGDKKEFQQKVQRSFGSTTSAKEFRPIRPKPQEKPSAMVEITHPLVPPAVSTDVKPIAQSSLCAGNAAPSSSRIIENDVKMVDKEAEFIFENCIVSEKDLKKAFDLLTTSPQGTFIVHKFTDDDEYELAFMGASNKVYAHFLLKDGKFYDIEDIEYPSFQKFIDAEFKREFKREFKGKVVPKLLKVSS